MRPNVVGFKSSPFHDKDRLYVSNLKLMPRTTVGFLSKRLLEQARQSNSKEGSSAEPLIFSNSKVLGGLMM